jgi:hypothetical protein
MESDLEDLITTTNRICQNWDVIIEKEKIDNENLKTQFEHIFFDLYKSINHLQNIKREIYDSIL